MNRKILHYIGIIAAGLAGSSAYIRKVKEMEKEKQLVHKNDMIIQCMDQFLSVKQKGKNLSDYFKHNDIQSVAIYGMGILGKRFYEELKDSDIQIKYAIDKNAKTADCDIEVYRPEEQLPLVDAVVITPIFYFLEIAEELEQYLDCQIISLEDVIDEITLSDL